MFKWLTKERKTVESDKIQILLSIKFYWNTATWECVLWGWWPTATAELSSCQRRPCLKNLSSGPFRDGVPTPALHSLQRPGPSRWWNPGVKVQCVTKASGIYLKSRTFKKQSLSPVRQREKSSLPQLVQQWVWTGAIAGVRCGDGGVRRREGGRWKCQHRHVGVSRWCWTCTRSAHEPWESPLLHSWDLSRDRGVSLQRTLVSLGFSHQGLVIAHVISIINYYYF